jgi:GT2 family glycosyltransferase
VSARRAAGSEVATSDDPTAGGADAPRTPRPAVAAIVVVYGAEPLLERCLTAVTASEGAAIELHVVDNGCTNPDLVRLVDAAGALLHRAPSNLGFAGGANLGAQHAAADLLCFVNSDAIVAPDTLRLLAARAQLPEVGIVCGSIRHLADPTLVNSAGNPMHLLGFVRAQRSRRLPAGPGPSHVSVATASGAAVMLRREVWDELGGFDAVFFLYHEDVDLSLAAWQRGYDVECVTDAVALHDYAFTGTPDKVYLAERNRLIVVLTRYPGWLLRRLVPLLVVAELGAVVTGGMDGLRRAKLRGWWWLVRHRTWLRRRRAREQATACDPDAIVGWLDLRFQHDAIDDLGSGHGCWTRSCHATRRLVGLRSSDGKVSRP